MRLQVALRHFCPGPGLLLLHWAARAGSRMEQPQRSLFGPTHVLPWGIISRHHTGLWTSSSPYLPFPSSFWDENTIAFAEQKRQWSSPGYCLLGCLEPRLWLGADKNGYTGTVRSARSWVSGCEVCTILVPLLQPLISLYGVLTLSRRDVCLSSVWLGLFWFHSLLALWRSHALDWSQLARNAICFPLFLYACTYFSSSFFFFLLSILRFATSG